MFLMLLFQNVLILNMGVHVVLSVLPFLIEV